MGGCEMSYIIEQLHDFNFYYKLDFKFVNRFLVEFRPDLKVKLAEQLELYLKGKHIATFMIASEDEKMRTYQISFYPEFITLPSEDDLVINSWEGVCIDFITESDNRLTVLVGPELLYYWCNKLVWEAVAVICYKSHH